MFRSKSKKSSGDFDCEHTQILIGDCGVGKTSLMGRYVHKNFFEIYTPTPSDGLVLKTKDIKLDDKRVRQRLWDTGGRLVVHGTRGVILVYDVTNMESFQRIQHYYDEVLQYLSLEEKTVILVGNKCDLSSRTVESGMGKELADRLDIPFIETSAKDSINVEQVFLMTSLGILGGNMDVVDIDDVINEPHSSGYTCCCGRL